MPRCADGAPAPIEDDAKDGTINGTAQSLSGLDDLLILSTVDCRNLGSAQPTDRGVDAVAVTSDTAATCSPAIAAMAASSSEIRASSPSTFRGEILARNPRPV